MKRVLTPAWPQSAPQKRQKLGQQLSVEKIIEAIRQLNPADLHAVRDFSAFLANQAPVNPSRSLPREIWKLIFFHTQTRSHHSFSTASALYDALNTLFDLKLVCSSWKKMAEQTISQLETIHSSNTPLMLRTVYLASVSGKIGIWNLLMSWDLCDYWEAEPLCLELACCFGNTEMVRLLYNKLDQGPVTNENYPIRLAVKTNHIEATRLLLQDPWVSPGAGDNYPISWASQCGYLEIVKLLLSDPCVDPAAADNLPIQVACAYGHDDVAKILLKDSRVSPQADSNYALRQAAQSGHTNVVRLLLQHPSVSPSAKNNEALRVAATEGHLEIVKLLLEHPKTTLATAQPSPLVSASTHGHLKIVDLLLNCPKAFSEEDGSSAIQSAALCGRLNVVKLLLTNPRIAQLESNKYLLINAMESRNLQLIQYLLDLPFIDPSLHQSYALRKSVELGLTDITTLLSLRTQTPSAPKDYVKWDRFLKATDTQANGDSFGLIDGSTDREVAEIWAAALGLGPPLSWETRTTGYLCVYSLQTKNTPLEEAELRFCACTPQNPVIFSLVCAKPNRSKDDHTKPNDQGANAGNDKIH